VRLVCEDVKKRPRFGLTNCSISLPSGFFNRQKATFGAHGVYSVLHCSGLDPWALFSGEPSHAVQGMSFLTLCPLSSDFLWREINVPALDDISDFDLYRPGGGA